MNTLRISAMLFLALFYNGLSAQTNAWDCQDDCLKEKDDQFCGTTDHFRVVDTNDDPPETMTITATIDITYVGAGNQSASMEGGTTSTVSVSELGAENPLFASEIISSESLEIIDIFVTEQGRLICSGNFSGALSADNGQFTSAAFVGLTPNPVTGGVQGLLEETEASTLSADNPIFVGGAGASTNVLASSINPNGGVGWVGAIETQSAISMNDMLISSDGCTYITGAFEGPIDFDLGLEFQNSDADLGADLFLAK